MASSDLDARLDVIHATHVFADIHAHPSRFHRANVLRIEDEEIEGYRRSRIDVVTCSISTDAVYGGNYTERDGTVVESRRYRPRPGEVFAFTQDRLARVTKTIEDGAALLATDPQAVLDARKEKRLSLLPALEGGDGLEGDLEKLRVLRARGLRLLQLVHFRANELGHIQTYPYSPGGLTELGATVVRECNDSGILVDLAHANTETLMDALAVSTKPVLVSHTGAKSLHVADRHLTDVEMEAVARGGGLIGIWPNGTHIPELEDFVRHVKHVTARAGVEHVGIGSDWRGLPLHTNGFAPTADFTAIAQALLEEGFTDDEVGGIMGENFFRLWQEIVAP